MLRPVGPGVAGELLIGGAGLARGYHNDPARTAERFIPDPLDPQRRRKMFRTGDLVRAGPDGALRFLGRRDQQVKVRGFRIELGEIETTLRSHSAVRNAAVIDIGEALDGRRLAAFVETDVPIPRMNWRHICAIGCPTTWSRAPSGPLPPSPACRTGKVDRLWLAAQAQRPTVPAPETERPRTPLEARIAAILEELLGHDRIGLDDNFFALGGTSLLGMRYLARINDVCNVRLGAAALLRAPTVAAMAQLVADQLAEGPVAETRELDVPFARRSAKSGGVRWR